MAKYKAAIISCGMITNNAHIPAYRHLPEEFEIAAVCDINEKAASDTAKRHNIPHYYLDAQEMLCEIHPDIVSVCVPNGLHKQYVLMALNAGCHVLCEKPAALSYADALEMYSLAKEKGKLLVACQSMRFTPDRLTANDFIKNKILGDIYYAEFSRIRRRGIPKWGTFHMKEMSGGGAFVDIGVHMIDSLLWLIGNPKVISVTATACTKIGLREDSAPENLSKSGALSGTVHLQREFKKQEMNVEDFASGSILFEGGLRTNFKVAWAANLPDETSFTIIGDRAGIQLPSLTLYEGEKSDTVMKPAYENPYQEEAFSGHFMLLDHIAAVLNGERELMIKPEETINTAAVLELFYRSAELGREVFLDSIKQNS